MFKYLYYIKAHTHIDARKYTLCANMLICCLHITSHTHTQTTVSACTPPLGCPPGWFVAHSFHAFHRWLQTKLQLNKQTKQEQIRECSVWLLPLPQLPSHPWLSSSATRPHCLPNQPGNDLIWMHALLCISIVVRFYGKILIKRCFRVHFLPNSATFYAVPVCFRLLRAIPAGAHVR